MLQKTPPAGTNASGTSSRLRKTLEICESTCYNKKQGDLMQELLSKLENLKQRINTIMVRL
jgi:hypothetical protein